MFVSQGVVLQTAGRSGRERNHQHHLRTPQERTGRLQQGDSDLLEFGGRPRRNHRAGQLDRSGTPQGQDRGGEDKV